MPGEDIQSWSVTAANNGNSDSAIQWSEGQTRASVNNSSRSEMAAIAKHRNLLNGSISTTNSGNAYAFTSGVGYTTVPTGLRVKLKIGTTANTGSSTLNMDGLGDVTIKDDQGNNLHGGELVANAYTDLLYNGSNWIFLYSHAYLYELITSGGGIIVGHQVFDTAGTFTYTPTEGMEACIIECIGGGGGGGCASSEVNLLVSGGGGGSGGYSRKFSDPAGIGASQTVIVGAAGVAATSPGDGGAGGDTSLGTLCIAKGGHGGGGSLTGGQFGFGGAGGDIGTGDVTAAGSPGQIGGYYAASGNSFAPGGGTGGSGSFGGGGVGNTYSYGGTVIGAAGRNYGSGGAGSFSYGGPGSAASGAGSAGIVIITEFGGRGAAGPAGETGPIGPPGPSGSGTGDVLRSGLPSNGQVAIWTDASHIQGVSLAATISTAAIGNVVLKKFTASGTYTPTTGMKYCIIECVGGGGGGGCASSATTLAVGGGGGGSGGYSRIRVTAATVGVSQVVTVGTGGAGGASPGPGAVGTDTSVGALCVGRGGSGGSGSVAGGQIGYAGAGGVPGTGDVTAAGSPGSVGGYSNTSDSFSPGGGGGGSSIYGGGGAPASANYGGWIAGNSAGNYGSGGGGSFSHGGPGNGPGGNGSAGIVIITEFI